MRDSPFEVAVVGGDSLIGAALLAMRGPDAPVAATSRRADSAWRLDLAAPPDSWRLPPARNFLVCAGLTNLGACEADPGLSEAVNFKAMEELARISAKMGARIFFLSTSQVFDGTSPLRRSGDARTPASVYGTHKAAAEDAVLGGGGVVIRLTKIVHPALPVVARWVEAWRRGDPCEAFDDAYLSPVPLPRAAEAIELVLRDGAPGGVYQISGAADVSYFEFALSVARTAAVDRRLVRATAWRSRLPGPSHFFPRFSSLDTGALAALGWKAPSSADAAEWLGSRLRA